MGRDEQIEEREVLDSIFPEEITGAHDLLFLEVVMTDHCVCRYFRNLLPNINSTGHCAPS